MKTRSTVQKLPAMWPAAAWHPAHASPFTVTLAPLASSSHAGMRSFRSSFPDDSCMRRLRICPRCRFIAQPMRYAELKDRVIATALACDISGQELYLSVCEGCKGDVGCGGEVGPKEGCCLLDHQAHSGDANDADTSWLMYSSKPPSVSLGNQPSCT